MQARTLLLQLSIAIDLCWCVVTPAPCDATRRCLTTADLQLLASGTIVYVLDENLHLSSSFGFAAAFPAIADDASASITALAVDPDPASRRVSKSTLRPDCS